MPVAKSELLRKIVASGLVAVVAAWINAGAIAVGVVGNLTAGARTGDFASITERARQFVEK
jgi:2-dehydro-3-deoxyphosphogluconate aldolase / (4S)-4-hydroxy-2-oxoglutarate aldolase